MLGSDESISDTVDTKLLVSILFQLLVLVISVVYLYLSVDWESALNGLVNPRLSISLPGYGRDTTRQIALKLMQVAVLYIAGIVAALRFMDNSARFDAGSGSIPLGLGVLSLLSVVASAIAAVLSLLRIVPTLSITVALVAVGFSFALSMLASLVSVASSSESPSDDERKVGSSNYGQWTPIRAEADPRPTSGEHYESRADDGQSVNDGVEEVKQDS